MTNLDSIFKIRDTTLLIKVHIVKAVVFPIVCKDVKVGPQRRLRSKKLMLLNYGAGEDSRVPWTAGRSNQFILKETDRNTIIIGYFNTPLTSMDRSSRQKINKATEILNDTIEDLDLVDIFKTLNPKKV